MPLIVARRARRPILLVLLALLLGSPAARAHDAFDVNNPPPAATAHEISEGDKAASELEHDKNTKFLDPKSSPEAKATLDKLNAMAHKLGLASKRPQISYTVRVIESKDVNAFTLPNGHIYVYRGLLDAVASDDELAGVLAHEIGHNVRMHALRGEKTSKKATLAEIAAMAAILAGGSNGANVGMMSQYLLVGMVNGYGEGYEEEADAAGVREMIVAGYNPSAMVTFMRRLQLLEDRSPEVQLGIYRTHPPSDQRADAMLAQIKAAGLTYTPREVTGAKIALVTEKPDRYVVSLGDITLLELAKVGPESKARAGAAAQKINDLMRDNVQMYEVTSSPDGQLLGRGQVIAVATPLDAKLNNQTPAVAAQTWLSHLRDMFWRESINGKI